jgi:hypothetical protein
MTRLRDLDGDLVQIIENGNIARESATANAVFFECPCGDGHVNLIAFEPTIGGATPARSGLSRKGGTWRRESGETVDDLTLSPSIAVRSRPDGSECWHGFIRNGEVTP